MLAVPAFAAAFITLSIVGYADTSATWDEPMHLTAGYVALAQGDFRVDPSHPPLLRMWAAIPALAMGPLKLDTNGIEQATPMTWLGTVYRFAHRVMYVDNDGDRILAPGRLMIVLLGVLLGALVYAWAREWLGPLPAVATLVLFLFEPNLMTHSSVVTTDLGVTAFIFGAIYFLWRTCRRQRWTDVAALALFCALAAASKFSAVILGPIVVALLGVAVARRAITARFALGVAVLLAAASFATIWAVYGFRYLPSDSPRWWFDFEAAGFVSQESTAAAVIGWADRHRLLPNAYAQGLLYTQDSSQRLTGFLAGSYSIEGWWYYFPVAMLIKTPITHLVLLAIGLATCVAQRRRLGALPLAFVLLPAGVYLAVAMSSGVNVGLRHVLPVYPFLLLVAAAGVQKLATLPGRVTVSALAILPLAGGVEFATAYPHTGTFFNSFVGGPANGFRYLVDSNLGWGRGLKPLKQWMDDNGIEHMNLAYFGQADPAYYGMSVTHLPGAPGFARDDVSRPKLPGYVAISPTILQGVYAPPHWRRFYRGFVDLEPVVVIGNSLRVYRVDEWPEPKGDARGAFDISVHRDLAEALLGLQWPEHAVLHFRRYTQERPEDARAQTGLGLALMALGRTREALTAFRDAVEVQPWDAAARLILADALLSTGNLRDAAAHVSRALELQPGSPDAYRLMGRIDAVRGLIDRARESFQRALALDPAHAGAREDLARLDARATAPPGSPAPR